MKFLKKHQFTLGLVLSLALVTACGNASFTGKTAKKGKKDSPTQVLPTGPAKPVETKDPNSGNEVPVIDPTKPVDPGVGTENPPVVCPKDPNPNQSGKDDPGQNASQNPGQSGDGSKKTDPATPAVCHDAKGTVVTCPVDCSDPSKTPVQN